MKEGDRGDKEEKKEKVQVESCRDDSQKAGLQVFRQHTSLVGRETEFDSRADLDFVTIGLLVQRDDTGIARRRSGFDSPAVH